MRFEGEGRRGFRGFGRLGGFGHRGVRFRYSVKESGGPLHAVPPEKVSRRSEPSSDPSPDPSSGR